MRNKFFFIGILFFLISNTLIAQIDIKKDTSVNFTSKKLITADEYFERANTNLKSKMFLLDSLTIYNAINDYLQAIKLKPSFWQARRNYARLMIYNKNYQIAIDQLNQALLFTKSELNPDLNVMRGQAYYELGYYEKSIIDFEIAEKYSGNIDYILLFKAKALWKLGFEDGACVNYYKAIKLRPNIINEKEFLNCK
jgi:tetratricopeptide (TPR) repeat protein